MKLVDVIKAIGAMGANPSLSLSKGVSVRSHQQNIGPEDWTSPELSVDQIARIQERIIGAIGAGDDLLSPTADSLGLGSDGVTDEEIEAFLSGAGISGSRQKESLADTAIDAGSVIQDARPRRSPLSKLFFWALLSMVLVSSTGLASQMAGPRDALYSMRIRIENTRIGLVSSDLSKSKVLLSIASVGLRDLRETPKPSLDELSFLTQRLENSERKALSLLKQAKAGERRNELLGRLLGISQSHIYLTRHLASSTTGRSRDLLIRSEVVASMISGQAKELLLGDGAIAQDPKYLGSNEVLTSNAVTNRGARAAGTYPMSNNDAPSTQQADPPEGNTGNTTPPVETERRCEVTNGIICITPIQLPSIPSS